MRDSFRDRTAPPPTEAAFFCEHCRYPVPGRAPGTEHRNHCPHCLWSLHVDMKPGDRRSGCRGGMEPIAIATRHDGEWSLIHRCKNCGKITANRIAGDDQPLPLVSLAVRPLARPPFPLSSLEQRTTKDDGRQMTDNNEQQGTLKP